MNFHELQEAVLLQTPALQTVLKKNKHLTIQDYFKKNLAFVSAISNDRQEELLSTIDSLIRTNVEPSIAETAIRHLRKFYYVSTADHHGPITHPFFVNSHLAQSYANQEQGLNTIFVFSCAGISLNNSSFPRGLFFHDTKLEKKRYHFFSLKNRHQSVFGFPAYHTTAIEKNIATIRRQEKMHHLVREIYLEEQVLNETYYADQISRSNYTLWKKIPGQEKTNLVYLAQEDIVNKLLSTFHLKQSTFLTELISNVSIIEQFEDCFEDIRGALSKKGHKGTTLFWAVQNGERKGLILKNNRLETIDGSFKVSLSSEDIQEKIEKKYLMPSMALSFIVLSLYYGLTCGGGFLQVNYLSEMKQAYLKLLKNIGEINELERVEKITTDYFCGEFAFAMMGNENRIAKASSIDLILYGNTNTGKELQELAKSCTLGESIDQMMPVFYKILYGGESPVNYPPLSFSPILYVS